MDEDARPFDVAQERMAEPRPAARTLDQPRHVRDRRPALVVRAKLHDPEVGFERRERVIGDLRRGGGHGSQERRLAGVRQPDKPDVGDQPQLEADPALLPGLALLGVLRRLVGGRLEVGVAEPAATAAGDHHLLSGGDQIGEELVRGVVEDRGAGRNAHHEVMARRTVAPRALAPTAVRRLEVVAVLEVAQGRLAGIHGEVHRTASTAIPAVRSAARDVRLAPEGRRAVAAVTGTDVDLDAVEEHRGHCPTAPATGRDAGRRSEGGGA